MSNEKDQYETHVSSINYVECRYCTEAVIISYYKYIYYYIKRKIFKKDFYCNECKDYIKNWIPQRENNVK